MACRCNKLLTGLYKSVNKRDSLLGDAHNTWSLVLEYLQARVDGEVIETWFSPIVFEGFDGDKAKVVVPNKFFGEWLERNYLDVLGEAFQAAGSLSGPVEVEFIVRDSDEQALPTQGFPQSVIAPNQKPSISRNKKNPLPNPKYTFDNFVVGASNQFAHAASRAVAESPALAYNPLFIYGGVGLGKTHLLHSIGNYIARGGELRIAYVTTEQFTNEVINSIRYDKMIELRRRYRNIDMLLIDDIQFLAGKERTQEEFFHTFNALLEGGQQMILTCDRYPKEIEGVEERLKSRFGWGLTVAVEPPELETRVAILKKKAESVDLDLPDEAAFFLAQRVKSNVRELEGALKRVIASAHFHNAPVDIALIKESLKDLLALQDKQVSIENIQRTVAEYYKIKVADLLSKRRSRSVARPRQVAMALAKELTNRSLPEIGDAFGGRDHTTVLHACRKIRELRETTSDIREDYQNFLRKLAG